MRTEAHRLRLENKWLKIEILKHNGGVPIEMPKSIYKSIKLPSIGGSREGAGIVDIEGYSGPKSELIREMSNGFDEIEQPGTPLTNFGGNGDYGTQDFGGRQDYQGVQMAQEFELEIIRLQQENPQLRYQKELSQRDHDNVVFENGTLNQKLENLEDVFIGTAIQRNSKTQANLSSNYTTSTVSPSPV